MLGLINIASCFHRWLTDPATFFYEYQQVHDRVLHNDKRYKKSHKHLVKGVIDDAIANVINLFTKPSWDTFIAFAIDFSSYGLMPLEGGFQAVEAMKKYNEDKLAYDDGGVTEDYLFK